jgi:glycosyltransferase involved in cell wall biosynthesis
MVVPAERVNIPTGANIGLESARGEYVARIDGDDVWLPNRLFLQVEQLQGGEHSALGVCGAHCWLIDAGGRIVGQKRYPLTHEACARAFMYRNPFCNSAALVRRACFDQLGAYDESFDLAQDLELWMRFGQQFELMNLDAYLVKYRVWETNVTGQKHRASIRHTLRARRRAARQYGYHLGISGAACFAATWCMQGLPYSWVTQLFHRLFLGKFLRVCWMSKALPDLKTEDHLYATR